MTGRCLLRRVHVEDDGQLLLLVLCYAVIAALLITVVVNLSSVYLHRRALVAAVDAAALTAANEVDVAELYRSTSSAETLFPLSQEGAVRAVSQYVEAAELRRRFDGFDVMLVTTRGPEVTVTMTATVHMPFLNMLSDSHRNGYVLSATATARSTVERAQAG